MKKRVWMTEADYKALKRQAAVETEEFARTVINVLGLAEQYPANPGIRFNSWGAKIPWDARARDFIRDVTDASKHAAAKDAVKRLRTAIKVVS